MQVSNEVQEALEENGYSSVKEYLHSLAEDYDVSYATVCALYSMLGDSELFDGLVCAVEDASGY